MSVESSRCSSPSITNVARDNEVEQRFLKILKREDTGGGLKKLEVLKTLGEGSGQANEVGGSEHAFVSCEDCRQLVTSYCELYHKIRCLELEASHVLSKLTNVMRQADKAELPGSGGDDEGGQVWAKTEILEMREELLWKCTRKLERTLPRVSLKRIKLTKDAGSLVRFLPPVISTADSVTAARRQRQVVEKPPPVYGEKKPSRPQLKGRPTTALNETFNCMYCDIRFPSKGSRRTHMYVAHHDEVMSKYKTQGTPPVANTTLCKVIEGPSVVSSTSVTTWTPPVTNTIAPTPVQMSSTLSYQSEFRCGFCEVMYPTYGDCRAHQVTEHSVETLAATLASSSPNCTHEKLSMMLPLIVDQCSEVLVSFGGNPSGGTTKCKICREVFEENRRSELRNHILVKHFDGIVIGLRRAFEGGGGSEESKQKSRQEKEAEPESDVKVEEDIGESDDFFILGM